MRTAIIQALLKHYDWEYFTKDDWIKVWKMTDEELTRELIVALNFYTGNGNN